MIDRTIPYTEYKGRLLSQAELERHQKRYEIGDLTREQKCGLIRLLTEFPQLMDYWRFTNRAIWVNLDGPDGVEGLLTTLDTGIVMLTSNEKEKE